MKRNVLRFVASILLGACVSHSCKKDDDAVKQETTVSQDITRSTTWYSDSVYIVSGQVFVGGGAVLTIQPGTTIQFASGASLVFGYTDNATIIADGTRDKPIIFTSSAGSPEAGAWDGIYFYSNTLKNSVMDNCQVLYAGGNSNAAVSLVGCSLSLDSCTIKNSGNRGLEASAATYDGGFVSCTHNTFESCEGYAMEISAAKASAIDTSNSFVGVGGILLTGSYSSTTGQSWKMHEVPYVVCSDIYVDGNLTIEPGATFTFDSQGAFTFGYNSSTTILAKGTASLPVTFTSAAASPTAGAWAGLRFYGNTLSSSAMEYCIVKYAGADPQSVLLFNCSFSFTHNTVTNGASAGVYFDGTAAGATAFNNNTINTCAGHPVSICAMQVPDLGTPNDIVAASGTGINVYAGDESTYESAVTWKNLGVDYYIDDCLYLDGTMTFEAGSVFRFGASGEFVFGYNASTKVTAAGTSTSPIVFTSSASSPAAGAWTGLEFSFSVLSNTSLNYCILDYCGKDSHPAIMTYAGFTVSNSQVNNNAAEAASKAEDVTMSGSGNNFSW